MVNGREASRPNDTGIILANDNNNNNNNNNNNGNNNVKGLMIIMIIIIKIKVIHSNDKKIKTLMIIIITVRVMLGALFLKIIFKFFFKRGIVERALVSTFGKSPVTLSSFAL